MEGNFRQDLCYRINVFPIEMPSLRSRPEDVPVLLNELISMLEAEQKGSIRFNSSAIKSLSRHPWLGNVRELANLVERMAILYPHGIVGVNDLPESLEIQTREGGQQIEFLYLEANLTSVSGSELNTQDGLDQTMLPLNGIDLKAYLTNLEKI